MFSACSNGGLVEEQSEASPVKSLPEEEEEEPEEEKVEEPEPVQEPVYVEAEPEKIPEPEPQPEVQPGIQTTKSTFALLTEKRTDQVLYA